MNYAKYLARGSITVFLFTVLANLFNYLIRLVLSRELSVADYGLFYAIIAFISFFISFRDLGLSAAIVKFIPEFNAKKEYGKIKSLLKYAFKMQLIFVISSIILISLFSNQISSLIFNQQISNLIILASFILFADLFMVFEMKFFQGSQKPSLFSSILLVKNIIILIILLFLQPLTLEKCFFSFISSHFITFLIFSPKFKKLYEKLSEPVSITKKFKKQIWDFSLPVFFGMIAYLFLGYIDTIMLTIFRSLEEVGLYQVALPTASLLFIFMISIRSVLIPTVSELWSLKETEKISKIMERATKLSFITILPGFFILFSFPKTILSILFGPEYVSAYIALKILSFTSIFFLLRGLMSTILISRGKTWLNTKAGIYMTVFNIISNLILIPIYGIIGAAVTTVFSFFIGFLITYKYSKKYLDFNFPKETLAKSLMCSALILIFIDKIKLIINLQPLTEFFVIGITSVIFYFVLLLMTKTIDKYDINLMKSVLK